MKKAYENIAMVVRWTVAGGVSFIIALPMLISFGTDL